MKNGVNKKYSLALLIAALLLTGCDSDEERVILTLHLRTAFVS